MSLDLKAFRRTGILLTTTAALAFPQAAHALDLQACGKFSAGFRAYAHAQPKGTFSLPFIQSVRAYVQPDGKTETCSGKGNDGRAMISLYKLDDFTGWVNVGNNARANGINVAPEVKLVVYAGGDPRLQALITKHERQLSEQAAARLPKPAP
jgi:hypothetical protein